MVEKFNNFEKEYQEAVSIQFDPQFRKFEKIAMQAIIEEIIQKHESKLTFHLPISPPVFLHFWGFPFAEKVDLQIKKSGYKRCHEFNMSFKTEAEFRQHPIFTDGFVSVMRNENVGYKINFHQPLAESNAKTVEERLEAIYVESAAKEGITVAEYKKKIGKLVQKQTKKQQRKKKYPNALHFRYEWETQRLYIRIKKIKIDQNGATLLS